MKTYISILAIIFVILISLTLFNYVNRKNIDKSLKLDDLINYYIENKKYIKNINDKIDLPIYYINLDRSTERNKFMKNQFDIFDLKDVTRISAIDGQKLNNNYFINDYHNMSNSEIGCTLSHIKAIKTAYEENREYAIIMEDDNVFYLLPFWVHTLKQIISFAPSDWDIIKLFNYEIKLDGKHKSFFVNHSNSNPTWSTLVYIINRKGMKKILDEVYFQEKIRIKRNKEIYSGSADIYIYGLVNTYDIVFPLFLCGDEIFESTINKNDEQYHINRSKQILKFYQSLYLMDIFKKTDKEKICI